MNSEIHTQEQAQLAAYLERQQKARVEGASKVIMDFGNGPEDASKYLTMRDPGIIPLKMVADPYCVLKDGEKKRAAWRGPVGGQFCWRNRDDRNTKALVHRRKLRPVAVDEIDQSSEHAVFDETLMDTTAGPRAIVTYESLCLYEVDLETAHAWIQAPIDRYRRDLTMMHYGASKELRSAGFGDVAPTDLAKLTGGKADQAASNMSIGPARVENAIE